MPAGYLGLATRLLKHGLTRRSPHLLFQDGKVSHPHRVPLGSRGVAAGEVERVSGSELLCGSLAVGSCYSKSKRSGCFVQAHTPTSTVGGAARPTPPQTTNAAARALAADTDVLLRVFGRPWATNSAPLGDGISQNRAECSNHLTGPSLLCLLVF